GAARPGTRPAPTNRQRRGVARCARSRARCRGSTVPRGYGGRPGRRSPADARPRPRAPPSWPVPCAKCTAPGGAAARSDARRRRASAVPEEPLEGVLLGDARRDHPASPVPLQPPGGGQPVERLLDGVDRQLLVTALVDVALHVANGGSILVGLDRFKNPAFDR